MSVSELSGTFYTTADTQKIDGIDTVSNLVFWSRFSNKLEPWHNVYIIQQ